MSSNLKVSVVGVPVVSGSTPQVGRRPVRRTVPRLVPCFVTWKMPCSTRVVVDFFGAKTKFAVDHPAGSIRGGLHVRGLQASTQPPLQVRTP